MKQIIALIDRVESAIDSVIRPSLLNINETHVMGFVIFASTIGFVGALV